MRPSRLRVYSEQQLLNIELTRIKKEEEGEENVSEVNYVSPNKDRLIKDFEGFKDLFKNKN